MTIVELDYNERAVSFDRLERMILDKPSNVIYFERNGKLYGIITMGDAVRDRCECSRWDDVLCNAYISAVVKGKVAKCMENYHVAVVDSDICSNNKNGGRQV